MLETPEGVERAFAKLDTIKERPDLLDRGRAGARSSSPTRKSPSRRAITAALRCRRDVEDQPFEIIWDGQIVEWDGWVVPADGPNVEAVKEYLYWATDTQRLADQAKYISYGPARASSAPLVGQHEDLGIDMTPHMPTNPDNYTAPIVLNNDFWTDYGDELRERFGSWMLQ